MEEQKYFAVIMAGGGGTRLWPLSRREYPKQMLKLNGDRSLFQIAVDRLSGLFNSDQIFVVTVADQAEALKNQCPMIPDENFLLEPEPRGTASVVGIAARVIQRRSSDAIMAVLTADHFIADEKKFRQLLSSAKDLANKDYLVTIGIQPTYPATGYGYIQRGNSIGEYNGCQAYQALKFKEKPNQDVAQKFIEQKDHDWNSGMFIWRADRILSEIETLMPDLSATLEKIVNLWDDGEEEFINKEIWHSIQPQTIDYGIMEKASRVAVLPAIDLGWNDVGSWESLFDVILPDEDGNIVIDADHLGLNTSSSLLCSEDRKRLIVTIGLKNMIIVDTHDALLICDRNDSQEVKKIVDQLKQNGMKQYL